MRYVGWTQSLKLSIPYNSQSATELQTSDHGKKKAMLITVGHKDFCGYYAAKADGYND